MDKEKIKKRVIEEIEKTSALINEYDKKTAPISPDNSLGRLTRMNAIANAGVQKTMRLRSEARLLRLKEALSRIDDNDFGECVRCGEMIPDERLLFLPESICCVKCLNSIGG